MERIDEALDAESDVALLLDAVSPAEEIVCYLIMDGWPVSEIAGHLGVSVGRVHAYLHEIRLQARFMFPERAAAERRDGRRRPDVSMRSVGLAA